MPRLAPARECLPRKPPGTYRARRGDCSESPSITNTRRTASAKTQRKSSMTETTPTTANRTLPRLPNAPYRPREYLTEPEVERLIEAARKRGRNGARDACAILLAYRHGF